MFFGFNRNPSAINYSLTLGLVTEVGGIDAVTVPIPNIRLSLTENNSMFFQGTIPLEFISKFNPTSDETSKFRLVSRVLNADETQPIDIAFRDASTVLVPRFGNEHVQAGIEILHGVSITENCNDNEIDLTYAA